MTIVVKLGRVAAGVAIAALGVAVAKADGDPKAMFGTLVSHETAAADHRGYYLYLSEERSDRTGGHAWTERVAETKWGKVHYLIAEDGKPLSLERVAAEKARVEGEGADPEGFKKAESSRVDDEQHAKQMLQLLPKAFLFDAPVNEGEFVKIGFKPNPEYSPNGMEEKVLHGMSGTVVLDAKTVRLREIDGRMPQDVSIGFGLLATIRAGSNFSTKREHVQGQDWKTEALHTDINGKAIFLKTIARKQESKHSDFKKLPDGITVKDAVAMLEKSTEL